MLLQFEAFARGFMTLCGGPAIHLFSATELERLVCGNPILDFEALQANARYDGGYSAEHRVSAVLAAHCKRAACVTPLRIRAALDATEGRDFWCCHPKLPVP